MQDKLENFVFLITYFPLLTTALCYSGHTVKTQTKTSRKLKRLLHRYIAASFWRHLSEKVQLDRFMEEFGNAVIYLDLLRMNK